MYLSDITMQMMSMLFVLIIGLYFFFFFFSFYRRERRRTREADTRRYTFEICFTEMEKNGELFRGLDYITGENKDGILIILDVFEKLAAGVYSDVLSEEVVKLYYGACMQNFYANNRFILFEIRKKKDDAGLYANYERFMEEWDIRQKTLDSRRGK